MSSAWVYRIIIIAHVSQRDALNLLSAQIDPDSGGDKTFDSATLSPTSTEPATHIIISTAATENMHRAMLVAMRGIVTPPHFWRMDAETWELQDSNISTELGEVFSAERCMIATGLQRVNSSA